MTRATLEAPRGLVRAALSAVLPHTGRESEETPALGRARLVATGDALLVWATDHRTAGLARIEHPEYLTDELPAWDMPASAIRKILQVFRAPTNADARYMWDDQPMRIEVGDNLVTFTEAGSIVDGQSLSLSRIVPAGEDAYPDVPRALTALAAAVHDAPAQLGHLNLDALARFTAAAKAYNGDLPLAVITPGHSVHAALVRIGRAFLGSTPSYPDARLTPADVRSGQLDQRMWWSQVLQPLVRPERVQVDQDTTDELGRQAAEVLREAGASVSLRVVRADPESLS